MKNESVSLFFVSDLTSITTLSQSQFNQKLLLGLLGALHNHLQHILGGDTLDNYDKVGGDEMVSPGVQRRWGLTRHQMGDIPLRLALFPFWSLLTLTLLTVPRHSGKFLSFYDMKTSNLTL